MLFIHKQCYYSIVEFLPVDVDDERLALDLPHLNRPALFRIALQSIQDVEESHARADNDLHLAIPVQVKETARHERERRDTT